MKNLYDPEVHRECTLRIHRLAGDAPPLWGKMSAGQMLAHCAEVAEVYIGKKSLEHTPLMARLFKGMIRKLVVSEKPYPRSSRTHPQFVVTERAVFETERDRLLSALDVFQSETKMEAAQREHPLFGLMTTSERGQAMYKHLDHHLTQFGV